MLISLNWISDFVDLPPGLDPGELAERLTRTTAEVEEVNQVKVGARGLVAGRIESVTELPGTRDLRLAVVDAGDAGAFETVTAAVVSPKSMVVYAPPGSGVAAGGEIATAKVAGRTSAGMILPGDALGITMAVQEAVLLDSSVEPGTSLPTELFDDWLIEIDNKSITHRPDLWGHYGVAREIAAICGVPLKPYPVVPLEMILRNDLPEVPISIAEAEAGRRYSGIVLAGVPTQPAPLWMQLRLGHVGMRPITGLVDLTNYVMADLGQPMHAFDAAKVSRIEVDWAGEGERFRTLDGVDREVGTDTLMIKCAGRSIAIAGVMGGLETEVSEATASLLLESANFDPATIRRSAIKLGLRTDASARFEKSLDPANTVLAIQRFLQLAQSMYPSMEIKSRLSDCYPNPRETVAIAVKAAHVSRTMGREVTAEEAVRILTPLGFQMTEHDTEWRVSVPSFRATNDVSIEVDVIEELARYIGYGTIEPSMPRVSMRRFEPNALHQLEQGTLEYFTAGHRFIEIHRYLWYETDWLAQLSVDPGPCIELANPAAEGLHRLRRTLLPGMLAAVTRNRFHFPAFSLIELGSVFEPGENDDREYRHVGLVVARRGKKETSEKLYLGLKGAVEGWIWRLCARQAAFARSPADAASPWEHPNQTAAILIGDKAVGRMSVVDLPLRRVMDEHLAAWAIAWAEVRLEGIVDLTGGTEPLGVVPDYPLVEMDFSFVVTVSTQYADVATKLAGFEHSLLKQIRYVGSYQGDSIGAGRRSLTVRAVVGDDTRTLRDEDAREFRREFESHLAKCGYETRSS